MPWKKLARPTQVDDRLNGKYLSPPPNLVNFPQEINLIGGKVISNRILAGLISIVFLVILIPIESFASQHSVNVRVGALGEPNVPIKFFVKTGAGEDDWETQVVNTNGDGDAIWNVEEHSSATFWKAELNSGYTPLNPLNVWIQTTNYPDFVIEWVIEDPD